MPQLSDQRRAARKDHLLDAAERILAERGGIDSIRELATEAGVTTGSVYAHFGGKQELMLETFERMLGRLLIGVSDAPDVETIARDLLGAFTRAEVGPFLIAMWAAMVKDSRIADDVRSRLDRYRDTLAGILAEAMAGESDADERSDEKRSVLLANMLIGFMQSLAVQGTVMSNVDVSAMVDFSAAAIARMSS